jgi:hypothetical protein
LNQNSFNKENTKFVKQKSRSLLFRHSSPGATFSDYAVQDKLKKNLQSRRTLLHSGRVLTRFSEIVSEVTGRNSVGTKEKRGTKWQNWNM